MMTWRMKAVSFLAVLFVLGGVASGGQIVVWTQPNGDIGDKAINEVLDEYNTANPGVKVVLETRGNNDHKVALRVAASGKQGPDIYQMWGGLGLGGEYVESGLSSPLDSEYKRYGWDDIFIPASLSDSKKYKGERHGVPFKIAAQAVYYNKELFKKAGIEKEPETYDELVDACEKLKKIKVSPITFGGSVNWHLMRLMDVLLEKNCGPKEHDDLVAMKVNWKDNPGAIKAFEDLKYWSDNYILRPYMGIGFDQSCNLFFIGRAAMFLDTDGLVPRLEVTVKNIDNYDFFPFPTGTDRLYFYSELFYVNEYSSNREEAVKFLNYFSSKEIQQKLLGKLSPVSVNRYVDYSDRPLVMEKKWREHFNKTEQTFSNGDQAFPLDVTTEYFRVINAVAGGKMTPEKAAAQMQQFIDNRR